MKSASALTWLMMTAIVPWAHAAAGWDGKIVDVAQDRVLTQNDLAEALSDVSVLVLGEKHGTPSVQAAQAEAIRLAAWDLSGDFTVGWEFLDHTARDLIAENFGRYARGEIDARGFLKATQGNDNNQSYIPILETVRLLGGSLIGVNLSRAQKAPVVAGGIEAADPALIPPGFEMGGATYFERFVEAMGGHAPERTLRNYFAAQCLTDDVMAHQLALSAARLRILVTGSFHADFFDGAAKRLAFRLPEARSVTIRFVDAADYREGEIPELLRDPRYGPIADYAWFVNEPTP